MRAILLITLTLLGVGAAVGVVLVIAVARIQRDLTAAPAADVASVASHATTGPATRPAPAASEPALRTIVLSASDAELHGAVLRLGAGKDQELTYWTSREAYVQWPLACPREARFRVEIVAACPSWAGGDFSLHVGDQTLTGKTPDTGGWRNYRTVAVGTVTISETKTTLSIKPATTWRGRMMNVRAVRLVPVAG